MDKETQKALEADGKKLRALTGEDHGPFCPNCLGDGWTQETGCCGNPTRSGECCGNGIAVQEQCAACNGTGRVLASVQPTTEIEALI